MRRKSFRGGIHPYDGKELSQDKCITDMRPQGELVYPLSQHIGAPAVPVVKKGDEVLAGQLIAEAAGFVSAPVHASASGVVKGIEPRFSATGAKADCIIVENDRTYREIAWPEKRNPEQLEKEQILASIREAGIVGMGGAGFPTHVKLSPKEPEKIEYVIANCAECEPYITANYRKMLEEPEQLVEGMKIVLKLFDHAKGILALEDNKKDCARILTRLVEDEPDIEVVLLQTRYPQGAERQLIWATTGRAINSAMLPADVGCVVDNVETLTAIYEAVVLGRPLISRVLTVTGDAITEPANFRVYTGTSHKELVEACQGFKTAPEKLISGGPMMGFAMFELDVPVTKTTSALLCLSKDEVREYEPTPCINCGKCVEVCPGRLIPSRMADYAERHDEETFLKFHGLECCECGCCSYICPAKRQLSQSIKSMRKTALANRRKAAAAGAKK